MKYVDRLEAVSRASLEIGVDAGMQKSADLFQAALALDGFGPERLERIVRRAAELGAEFDGAYGCGPEADWLQERWTRSFAKPVARISSRSANETRISKSLTTRYQPGARKNDLDLWRGLLP